MRIRDEELRMERLLSKLREIGRIDNKMDGEATEIVDLAEPRARHPVALSAQGLSDRFACASSTAWAGGAPCA